MMGDVSLYGIAAPFVSFAITWIVVTLVLRRFSDKILDHPNERSLHGRPIPRTGGIGVLAGIAAGVAFVSPWAWWPLWTGAIMLMGFSFLDDLVGLPIVGRLLVHFIAAGLAVFGLLDGRIAFIWLLMVIVVAVWMVNLYNFMDGMDGLAGGMAVIGFGFFSVAAWIGGARALMLMSLCIAASSAAFLLYNFHPSRIFLGDAGSTAFGLLAGGLGLVGWRDGVWSPWFPLFVFSPFIVDASVTLVRRIVQRKRFWEAHREHYYQRLVLTGWSHRKTAICEYTVMILCGIGALLTQQFAGAVQWVLVVCWAVWFFGMAQAVSLVEQQSRMKDAINAR